LSKYYALKSLEGLLEAFLDKVVLLKAERLQVLEGVNRLDDIARMSGGGGDVTDEIGEWFASHNQWLNEDVLKTGDAGRIGKILTEIKNGLTVSPGDSAASRKIESEINRWSEMAGAGESRLTLRHEPEQKIDAEIDSMVMFDNALEGAHDLYRDLQGGKQHVLSVLDDALRRAVLQKNKQALILSAFMIYYLKHNGYLVEPFVKRLKEAERIQKEDLTIA
jgi:actin-related protein